VISFREIEIEDAKTILDWRTSERVTKFMNSDMKYDVDAQKRWLEDSYNKPSYYHWIIQYSGNDVGLLNFVDWNKENRTTSWGFYIGEDSALGVGGLIPPYFYNFAFDQLSVDRVLAEVFYDNTGVIDLHLKQGYVFDPIRDHVIEKSGRSILMVCMSLDKKEFKASKLSRLKKELPTLKWAAGPANRTQIKG
jgi:UDP-4-amino-4,6-dideoxy-N-acetyl-beta-L-altrosamine N-acetyltransferase